ncbi:MAG TPA: aminotransferase class III-fold pyridoxal phosphate-dependent enzyme [Myxococcota bacterium]|nr:aminotransferase class III-fold pyridoxal phosphate-dependent enzyme [Myxococcota bacterium]
MNKTPSLDHFWLPFTPNRAFKREPRLFARAEGVHYFTPEGRRILDGCSGLFCTPLGHGRREIADAVHEQLLTLDYTPTFTRAHPKAFELATRIAQFTPAGLDRVFFANSGSEAVDSAMKIALAYHRARGEGQRTMFVSRERAYHGVNMGGVALSGLVRNRESFGSGVPGVVHMRHTHVPENRFARGLPEKGGELADDLARLGQLHSFANIAAVFIEPIAGSTGCLPAPRGYLERVRELCDQHGILLVFDEVITGWGRTGQAFAAQELGVTPDLITMAKALTNGAQPMGAVAVKRAVHDAIVERGPLHAPELFHGYTYSAHPAACAAALATLALYDAERSFEQARALAPYFQERVFSLCELPMVADVRGYGLLAGIDLRARDGAPGLAGDEAQKRLFDAGLHLKATGDALLIAPAFVFTRGQVDELVGVLRDVLSNSPPSR